jgi:hypothetical protein
LLRAETFRELHALVRPPGETTMSFIHRAAPWCRGEVLWHNGCDGTCFALVHLVPADYATCVATNYGGKGAEAACNELHLMLVRRIGSLKDGRYAAGGRWWSPRPAATIAVAGKPQAAFGTDSHAQCGRTEARLPLALRMAAASSALRAE